MLNIIENETPRRNASPAPEVRDPTLPLLNVPRWHVRMIARAIAFTVVAVCRCIVRMAELFGRAPGRRALPAEPIHILLTGTFHSDNWLHAHLRPLALCADCKSVTVVSDRPMGAVPKVRYVCPPAWLRRICGRVVSRSIVYMLTALREKPALCGGFHLLCNGLLALATARLIGAHALYFCVGGRTEIIGGGAYGENGIFGRIGRHDTRLECGLVRLVNQIDAIVTMGNGARRFIMERGVNVPIHVNPGGVETPVDLVVPAEKDIDVIITCRLAPVKRLDIFLQALREVANQYPQLKAVIVGDGQEAPRLRELADKLELSRVVHFAGLQKDVLPWLQRAKLFLLTSDSEGVPLSILEGLQMGLPCVASDVGDVGDLVHEDKNGYRVPRRNVAVFAQRVLEILKNPSLREQLAENARRTAAGYTRPAVAEKWTGLLNSLRSPGEPAASVTRALP